MGDIIVKKNFFKLLKTDIKKMKRQFVWKSLSIRMMDQEKQRNYMRFSIKEFAILYQNCQGRL